MTAENINDLSIFELESRCLDKQEELLTVRRTLLSLRRNANNLETLIAAYEVVLAHERRKERSEVPVISRSLL